MARTVASITPVNAPFQPAWAAPTTPSAGSANRIGPQSAVAMPRASPSARVTMASARGRSAGANGASTVTASAE